MGSIPTSLHVQNHAIPLVIKRSWRKTARVSLTKSGIHLTVPYATVRHIQHFIDWAQTWVENTLTDKPELISRYKTKKYAHGDSISLCGTSYALHIIMTYEALNLPRIHLAQEQNKIIIDIPSSVYDQKDKIISLLLPKLFAKVGKKYITQRVAHFNNLYFNEYINRITLKNNKTNWGSCSAKKNLNFAVRLLLAPADIIDYVVIHEMAHLKELNHSEKFWSIVKAVDPNYKHKEAYLKKNDLTLDF